MPGPSRPGPFDTPSLRRAGLTGHPAMDWGPGEGVASFDARSAYERGVRDARRGSWGHSAQWWPELLALDRLRLCYWFGWAEGRGREGADD